MSSKQETAGKLWKIADEETGAAKKLAGELGVSRIVAQLLINRGHGDAEEAGRFLRPSLDHLYDPEGLSGISEAVGRISKAIAGQERILIYGDYDVDGMTSVALLHHLFQLLPARVTHFLPRRLEEGYGLNAEMLGQFKKDGIDLVITVDCGIGAREEARIARELGIDLIITDHHEPEGEIPEAVAVINPKLLGSRYPYRELAGVGVAFKLAWAIAKHFSGQKRVSPEFREFLLNAIGLVALGTVADVVPLTGENRVFVSYGLEALWNSRLPGVRALISLAGLKDGLTARDVAYGLAPRLNATGRLNKPLLGLELLTTQSFGRAMEISRVLDEMNRQRQAIERRIRAAAVKKLLETCDPRERRVLVLAGEGWHLGVLGIVASRIAEEYYRPTLLVSVDGEVARGSARSIPGFHMFDALKSCEDLLIGFGGHAQAAGLSMEAGRVDDLREALEAEAAGLTEEDLTPSVSIDAEVTLGDVTPVLVRELEMLAPFGEGNREPMLMARGVRLAGKARRVGTDGQHLSFYVRAGGGGVRAIAFGWGDFASKLERHGGGISVVFEPQIDTFRGEGMAQLVVRDMRLE